MILDDLTRVILERKRFPSPESYVSSLFSKGREEMLKKIGEESVEVIVASLAGDKGQIVHEMADLWFHCLVLLSEEGLNHEDVLKELRNRLGKRRK